jgi:hypothetical protein
MPPLYFPAQCFFLTRIQTAKQNRNAIVPRSTDLYNDVICQRRYKQAKTKMPKCQIQDAHQCRYKQANKKQINKVSRPEYLYHDATHGILKWSPSPQLGHPTVEPALDDFQPDDFESVAPWPKSDLRPFGTLSRSMLLKGDGCLPGSCGLAFCLHYAHAHWG